MARRTISSKDDGWEIGKRKRRQGNDSYLGPAMPNRRNLVVFLVNAKGKLEGNLGHRQRFLKKSMVESKGGDEAFL